MTPSVEWYFCLVEIGVSMLREVRCSSQRYSRLESLFRSSAGFNRRRTRDRLLLRRRSQSVRPSSSNARHRCWRSLVAARPRIPMEQSSLVASRIVMSTGRRRRFRCSDALLCCPGAVATAPTGFKQALANWPVRESKGLSPVPSLTIARWLTHVYDADKPVRFSTTPGDLTDVTRANRGTGPAPCRSVHGTHHRRGIEGAESDTEPGRRGTAQTSPALRTESTRDSVGNVRNTSTKGAGQWRP